MSKVSFTGASGRKPQTEAKRYVLHALATILRSDIEHADYLHDGFASEPDQRRAVKAAKAIRAQFLRQIARIDAAKKDGHDE